MFNKSFYITATKAYRRKKKEYMDQFNETLNPIFVNK